MKWFTTAVLFLLLGMVIGWQGGAQSAEKSFNKQPAKVTLDMSTAKPIDFSGKLPPGATLEQADSSPKLPPGAVLESSATAPKPKIDELDSRTGKFKYANYGQYEEAKDQWLLEESVRRCRAVSPPPTH